LLAAEAPKIPETIDAPPDISPAVNIPIFFCFYILIR
jgi:hypothetical protein